MPRLGSETVTWGTSLALGIQAVGLGPVGEPRTVVVVGAVLVLSVLAGVAYGLLRRDSTEPEDRTESGAGSDEDDGIDVTHLPERFIQFANAPETYVGAVLSTLIGGLTLNAAGYPGGFVLALYGPGLFGLMGLLKFGWPRIERFYERRETVERDPDSIRYDGFSTDAKVLMTLFLLCFLGLLLTMVVTTAL